MYADLWNALKFKNDYSSSGKNLHALVKGTFHLSV